MKKGEVNIIINEKVLKQMLERAYQSGWHGSLELCEGEVAKIIDDNKMNRNITYDCIINNICYAEYESVDDKITVSPTVFVDSFLVANKTVGDG